MLVVLSPLRSFPFFFFSILPTAHTHTVSIRRRYESLFSEARAQDVSTFLHQNNNKLYFLLHINSFLLVLLDAFSSRFFNTNVLFLYTLYSSFFFWCLVQSGLFLFLKLAFLSYSSTALAGGYSCVTLTLTLTLLHELIFFL